MKTFTAALAALVLLAVTAFAGDKFPAISHDALKKVIAEKKVTLIDVNGSKTYQAGHIPGALDFDVIEDDLAKLLPADKSALVVAYCSDEQCAAFAFAAEKARELGYTNVQHYAPGILGWKKAGEPTAPGK